MPTQKVTGELVILRGLPASGKSTFANLRVSQDLMNTIRVNRDDLRKTLHNGVYSKGVTEDKVIRARNILIEGFLKKGMTVISDDTNLPRRTVVELIKLAKKHGASWSIHDLTDVDVEVCVDRDRNRTKSVGEHVVRDLYNRFLKGKPPLDVSDLATPSFVIESYVAPKNDVFAYICDIDGTTALMDGRSPYDYSQVAGDIPNWPVISTVEALWDTTAEVVFLSGRPEDCREATEKWLRTYFPGKEIKLFMRASGDRRADYIVKYELFNEHIRNEYDVIGVFDDRNQVVDLWRKLGLTCFQCAPGEF